MKRMTNAAILAQYKAAHGIPDSVELLTYGSWLKCGYRVRKGERAAYRVPLWKVDKDNKGNVNTAYQKVASLFTREQVEKI